LVYRSQGKFDAAEEMCREVLQRRIATLDHDHLDTLGSKHLLAVLHGIKGQFHLAQPLYQEVLRVRTAKQGADHPDTLTSRHHLALLYASMDKPDQAIPMLKETLALRKIRLSPEHPSTLDTQADLGINLCNAGRQAEGIVQLEEVHQKGLSDRRLVRVTGILLGAYLRAGKTAKARALAEELLQTARDKFADDSLDHFAALADAGWLLTEWKSFADAEPLLREAVSRGDSFFVDSWRTHHARLLLGVALLGQQKFADAEPLLVLGYEALRERESQIPRETGAPLDQSVQWAVELYEAAGQAGKAADWRTRLEDQTTRSDK
jgi:tetratricopeptide (TPR) repeat protein